MEKIKLTEEEKALIDQSHKAVAKQKAAEKLQQEAEKKRLQERQELLEKNQRSQKRFIRWISVALVAMIVVTLWAYNQKQKTQVALKNVEKEQARAKAIELKGFGDSYKDLGSFENACESYTKSLKALENYPDDPLYNKLKEIKDSLKCN